MYCSNCGAKVQDGANYCHICGHKLITTSKETSEKTSDKTRVFDPSLLDNINHDDNLKEIVHTLDEKIAKEIYKHTNPESRDDFIGPKAKERQVPAFKDVDKALPAHEKEDTEALIETVDEPKEDAEALSAADEKTYDTSTENIKEADEKIEAENISAEEEKVEEPEELSKRKKPFNLINSREFFEKPTDEFNLNPDTVKEEVEEEVEKLKSEIKKKKPPKQKRSFRSIWDSFISERNDEFSIFAEYTNPGIVPGEEQKKKDKKEVVDQTLTNLGSIEQTMPVPIITDEVLKDAEAKNLSEEVPCLLYTSDAADE